jgi:hypothetical protein
MAARRRVTPTDHWKPLCRDTAREFHIVRGKETTTIEADSDDRLVIPSNRKWQAAVNGRVVRQVIRAAHRS